MPAVGAPNEAGRQARCGAYDEAQPRTAPAGPSTRIAHAICSARHGIEKWIEIFWRELLDPMDRKLDRNVDRNIFDGKPSE